MSGPESFSSKDEFFKSFEERRDAIFSWIATMRQYDGVIHDTTLQNLLNELHKKVDLLQENDPGAQKILDEAEIELATYEQDLDEDDFP